MEEKGEAVPEPSQKSFPWHEQVEAGQGEATACRLAPNRTGPSTRAYPLSGAAVRRLKPK